nr:hypothetical protein [Tanacetum cinerariifolium]
MIYHHYFRIRRNQNHYIFLHTKRESSWVVSLILSENRRLQVSSNGWAQKVNLKGGWLVPTRQVLEDLWFFYQIYSFSVTIPVCKDMAPVINEQVYFRICLIGSIDCIG